MSTVYICTQGTSISNGCTGQLELQKRMLAWEDKCFEFERQLSAILHSGSKGPQGFLGCSAETTVVGKCGIVPGDRVVLLCSDGYLGRVCGAAIRDAMVLAFDISAEHVEVVRVEDLQVKDAERLSKYGIPNFIDAVRRAIEKYQGEYEVVLCPNGGYKGVVPFLTILGMLYHCNVVYTFEHANSIVKLPALPFTFNEALYLRARRALVKLTDRIEMHENEFLHLIDNFDESERDSFLGFVQYTRPGYVTPSPLVDVLVQQSAVREAYLSKQAFEDLRRSKSGIHYNNFCRMILNSQDRIWRDQHSHTLRTTDLIAIKRDATTERLLGYPLNGRFYVARALQHNEYEEVMSKIGIADFPETCFSLWHRDEVLDVAGDDLSSESDLIEKNDALNSEVIALRSKCSQEDGRIFELENKVATVIADNAKLQETAYQLEKNLMSLGDENKQLRVQNEREAEEFSIQNHKLTEQLDSFKSMRFWERLLFLFGKIPLTMQTRVPFC